MKKNHHVPKIAKKDHELIMSKKLDTIRLFVNIKNNMDWDEALIFGIQHIINEEIKSTKIIQNRYQNKYKQNKCLL